MSELLYPTDSYLREFSAVVAAVHESEPAVALDRTAFYPAAAASPATMACWRPATPSWR
jgi:misacylated tRNA(Ala) deacylase